MLANWQGKPALGAGSRIGALAFIHRLGGLLSWHVPFRCIVSEGVLEADASGSAAFCEIRVSVRILEALEAARRPLTADRPAGTGRCTD